MGCPWPARSSVRQNLARKRAIEARIRTTYSVFQPSILAAGPVFEVPTGSGGSPRDAEHRPRGP